MGIVESIINGYNLISEMDELIIQKNTDNLNEIKEIRLEFLVEKYQKQMFVTCGEGLEPRINLKNLPEFVGRNLYGFLHPIKSLKAAYYDIKQSI